jgi:hypothetical protein
MHLSHRAEQTEFWMKKGCIFNLITKNMLFSDRSFVINFKLKQLKWTSLLAHQDFKSPRLQDSKAEIRQPIFFPIKYWYNFNFEVFFFFF